MDRRFMRDLREAARILEPNEVVDHNDRGNRYRERGEYDRALREFDRALEIAPYMSQIHSNRGNAHAGKGHFERAIADYDEAVRLDPGRRGALCQQGGRETREWRYGGRAVGLRHGRQVGSGILRDLFQQGQPLSRQGRV